MSQQIIWYVESSTSFIYDSKQQIINNKRQHTMWVQELAEICTLLSEKGFTYNIDENYNIINLRSE